MVMIVSLLTLLALQAAEPKDSPVPPAFHWAFRPIQRPPVPAVKEDRWIKTPIDAFILASLEKKNLSPAPPADRRTLLRRATYDLIGLPPTPQEIDAFLADDSPDAFAKRVDRLLASPAYGERWGRHWLDVVRYADARDLIQLPVESDFREAWRYRDWVVDAHNRDLPYPDFIRHQIAGDLLQPADPELMDTQALIATGMLAIADFVPGDVDKEQMIADYVNDQIEVVGRAFLGLTLSCARCHDHKFDPISMEDYYALAGIFFSTRLIPSPVPGNTPLVRVPLLPRAEVERMADRKKRVAELEKQIQNLQLETDLEFATRLDRIATEQTARYLLACWEFVSRSIHAPDRALTELAREHGLHPKILTQWLDYLGLRDYRAFTWFSRDEGGWAGLHRWSHRPNSTPAIHVSLRKETVEHHGAKFPSRSVALTPSQSSGAVLRWTSPTNMTVRWTGSVTDATSTARKGFVVSLDLRAASSRKELASFQVAAGGSAKLESAFNLGHLAEITLQSGDSLDLVVLPQATGAPTALVEWTIEQTPAGRVWNLRHDVTQTPDHAPLEISHRDHPQATGSWSFLETADVQRPGREPGQGWEALTAWQRTLTRAGQEPIDRSGAEAAAFAVGRALAAVQRDRLTGLESSRTPRPSHRHSELLKLQASDAHPTSSGEGRVTWWPNHSRSPVKFAAVAAPARGPLKTNLKVGGRSRPVLRFTGNEGLEAPLTVPPAGSLFAVFRIADASTSGQRLIGWEDSSSGKHGIGLMPTPGGGLHAIVRKHGAHGDVISDAKTNAGFEIASLSWGPLGTTLHRQGLDAGKNSAVDGVSSDPEIKSLRIGGPGSGNSAKFRGDLAELRVYNRPLDEHDRAEVEKELFDAWVDPNGRGPSPPDPVARLADELSSPQGPYWLDAGEREALMESESARRLVQAREQLHTLRKSIPATVPQAVVVQDGGPVGTKHEGFRDAPISLRGNPKNPGKVVPRGFPKVLSNHPPPVITEGSGRLPLGEWIASTQNPLTARVAVNRIWQHHFGEGIVRTTTNFGEKGDRPSHPELLDHLAVRFMESGWSIKAIHRLIMLSSVYQQSSRAAPETLAADPENQLWGRMPRRRLDAESLRDSLLYVANRLHSRQGGEAFRDELLPRRTLYMMSVRTGTSSGFASVFDGPDCSAVVEKRGDSIVAPQALFFLNDPFSRQQAEAMAQRILLGTTATDAETQIREAYRLTLGRAPTSEELDIGREQLTGTNPSERLGRYCQLLLSANEFVFID